MTSQPRDKTRDSTKHDTAKFGIDLYNPVLLNDSIPLMLITPVETGLQVFIKTNPRAELSVGAG